MECLEVLTADGAAAGITVGLPEVAMREATRKLRQELEERERRLDKLSRELRRLRIDVNLSLPIDDTVADYERSLREQTTFLAGNSSRCRTCATPRF
jgi:hypothetical protein